MKQDLRTLRQKFPRSLESLDIHASEFLDVKDIYTETQFKTLIKQIETKIHKAEKGLKVALQSKEQLCHEN